MNCRIADLRNKQVVCVKSGEILGYVSDVEFNTENGRLEAIVIFGKPKLMGLFGKYEDIIIPWADIEVIGQETILVKNDSTYCLK
jgi:YlmC/YmxH family sporulation protein